MDRVKYLPSTTSRYTRPYTDIWTQDRDPVRLIDWLIQTLLKARRDCRRRECRWLDCCFGMLLGLMVMKPCQITQPFFERLDPTGFECEGPLPDNSSQRTSSVCWDSKRSPWPACCSSEPRYDTPPVFYAWPRSSCVGFCIESQPPSSVRYSPIGDTQKEHAPRWGYPLPSWELMIGIST